MNDELPVIVIQNKCDQNSPLGITREWTGDMPKGWIQVGFIGRDGHRYMNFQLDEEDA